MAERQGRAGLRDFLPVNNEWLMPVHWTGQPLSLFVKLLFLVANYISCHSSKLQASLGRLLVFVELFLFPLEDVERFVDFMTWTSRFDVVPRAKNHRRRRWVTTQQRTHSVVIQVFGLHLPKPPKNVSVDV